MSELRRRRTIAAVILLGLIFLLISGLYLLLVLNDRVPTLGLSALGGLWLVYALLAGRISFSTPLDLPILGLIALLPLSLSISVDHALSLPKVYGLLLGAAIFYWIVNFVWDYQRLMWAILGMVLLGLGITILGAAGMDWSTSRFADLIPAVPQLADADIHVNTLGGALTFFIPILGALAWDGGAFDRLYLGRKRARGFLRIVYKVVVIVILLLAGGVLLLTDSRGAILGVGVGLLALAIWKDRRFAWLIPIMLLAALALFFILADGNLSQLIAMIDAGEDQTISGRLELWRNTLLMIQDFPLTGAGIGTYGAVFDDLYIVQIFPFATMRYLHAHNTFLAVGVDLGLPALVLYSALLTIFTLMFRRMLKIGRSILKTFLQGLACGLLAHYIFGLFDAFVLGTKLGFILWIFLGLGAAVYVHKGNFPWQSTRDGLAAAAIPKPDRHLLTSRILDMLLGFGAWLLIALAAISFVNLSPLLSVLFSIAGGIFLGAFVLKRFRRTSLKLKAES